MAARVDHRQQSGGVTLPVIEYAPVVVALALAGLPRLDLQRVVADTSVPADAMIGSLSVGSTPLIV
jgi:hypothetical protein